MIWFDERSVVMNACAVIAVVERADVVLLDAELLEPLAIRLEVGADRRHRQRRLTEQLQVVRDIRRATAELAPQLRHEERDVQHVNLVGEDVVLERVLEHHDVVVGRGTTD